MGRFILAAVLGGIAVFMWGFVYWAVLPLANKVVKHMPDEAAFVVAANAQNLQSGVYYVPGMPHPPAATAEAQKAEMDAWAERHKAGPIAFVHFRKEGVPPMSPIVMARGVLINIVFAGLLAWLIGRTLSFGTTYLKRVMVAAGAGLATVCVTDLLFWNFFYISNEWTGLMGFDHFMAFVVAGLVIAALIKPRLVVSATYVEATSIRAT